MLSQLVVDGIECVLCESKGGASWKLAPGVLWTLPMGLFSLLCDFALCPFSVINHSRKYNYMPRPASPLSKSSSCSWGPRTHRLAAGMETILVVFRVLF